MVLAVSPRLLADAVRRALEAGGIATVEVGSGPGDDVEVAVVEVAVVSAGREAEVRARTVITLAGDGDDGALRVHDLAGLRAALSGLVPRSGD